MKHTWKIICFMITLTMMMSAIPMTVMAASHDSANPTVLELNTEYQSNAGYGDEYYTFDIENLTNVDICIDVVPIYHEYTLKLYGSNIDPIIETASEDNPSESDYDADLVLSALLEPGQYYLELTSTLDDWTEYEDDISLLTEPDEAFYNIVIWTSNGPVAVDNSDTKYFPAIADQGDTDSSVGYATTYYQMTYTVARANDADSAEYTFSPEWTYSLINEGSDSGAYASDSYKVLSDYGAPLMSEFTGTVTSIETDADVWKSAMKYRLNSDGNNNNYSEKTFSETDDFIASMKARLANGDVLVTGSNANWWYGDDADETVSVIKNGETTSEKGVAYIYDNGKDEGRQLLTIVGYDDNITFEYGPYTTNGAFKIANSRGTEWGNDGYIWVSYEAFYQDSEFRPAKRNGYGFTSSWWWQDLDQNVYYSMYTSTLPHEPEYVGIFSFNGQDISDMVLTYRGRLNASSEITGNYALYDNTDYIKGIPSTPFTGSIALDLSSMSDYFTNAGACWEVMSDGISSTPLTIHNNSNGSVYSGSGTEWHTHVYDRTENFGYSGNRWYRYDACPICGSTNTVSGICYMHMDFESSTGSWGNNGKGVLSRESDSDGNTYLKIDYSNPNDTSPKYFDIYSPSTGAYTGTQISGNIEMSFDVQFEGGDADIMFKRRQPGIDNIILRICSKEGNRLMYGTNGGRNYFSNSNGWINSLNTWYTIEIAANITTNSSTAKQDIKVINKDTGEVVASVTNANLQNNDSFGNLLEIGGSCTVNIDNIAIRKIS